jgi:hypothetical protein
VTGLDPERDLARALNECSDIKPYRKPKPGGRANIGYRETIAMDLCWCGREKDHDWTGREDGAPHPRYPD